MRRMRILGLCLVAMFAFSSMAAASASAVLLHEWKECSKAKKVGKEYTGHYTSKECTLASFVTTGGKYELLEVTKKTFTSKSKVSRFYSFIPSNEALPLGGGAVAGKIECKTSKDAGEFKNAKLATDTILFSGCTSEGKKCTSAGEPAGSVKTNLLSIKPELGVPLPGKVLLLTGPAEGNVFAEFNCEGAEVKVLGALLGLAVGNVQQAVKTAHLTWQVNKEFGQEPVLYQCSFSDSEEAICQNFLTADVTPPGVTLYASAESLQEFKFGGQIGIWPA